VLFALGTLVCYIQAVHVFCFRHYEAKAAIQAIWKQGPLKALRISFLQYLLFCALLIAAFIAVNVVFGEYAGFVHTND
jgi:hypothetical protein